MSTACFGFLPWVHLVDSGSLRFSLGIKPYYALKRFEIHCENEFLSPISQSDFVGVHAMYLALLLALRVARALEGPEGRYGQKV